MKKLRILCAAAALATILAACSDGGIPDSIGDTTNPPITGDIGSEGCSSQNKKNGGSHKASAVSIYFKLMSHASVLTEFRTSRNSRIQRNVIS